MRIRKTTINDLDAVMKIYARARSFMAENGNPTQWKDSYPSEELIRKDILDGVSYVCIDDEGSEALQTDSDREKPGINPDRERAGNGSRMLENGNAGKNETGSGGRTLGGENGGGDEAGSGRESPEEIEAVFMYDMREDPTYAVIENGSWANDRPYGVLHRIASSGRKKGAASFCMQWCFAQCGNLRCDTHDNNKVMQHVMKKNGFEYCGRIYVEDGSPRVAFQKEK